jgi:site-specific DNA-methyltransferase (adenine-specific)
MSARNKTLTLHEDTIQEMRSDLSVLTSPACVSTVTNRILCQDMMQAAPFLPESCVDLLVLDPPYNMHKRFNDLTFSKSSIEAYTNTLDAWIQAILHTLKPTASIYICGDWHSSTSIHLVASRYFTIRNRITWEREKGRGALTNWKNCSEDIWFCTLSDRYVFHADAVKLKRKVIAPYRHENGTAKDWEETCDGNYRLTSPSNLWTDITIPFWSMPENTNHPTQKPEKLIAKLILASSNKGDLVFDPFLGSGTSAVVAKKLERQYLGIEQDETYACYALHRMQRAEADISIQGYHDNVFWERNTLAEQQKTVTKTNKNQQNKALCDMFEGTL